MWGVNEAVGGGDIGADTVGPPIPSERETTSEDVATREAARRLLALVLDLEFEVGPAAKFKFKWVSERQLEKTER